MASNRKSAIAVGVLFFIATAAYLTGSGLITSALNAPDSISNLNDDQIRTGVLLEFINAAAVVGIAALLFPILRKYSEAMAFGYAASRTIEAVLLVVSVLSALLLLPIWHEQVQAAASNTAQLKSLGTLAITSYELAFQLAMIALGAGSLLLCYILYKFALVPRALSGLGFVGYIALFASGWLQIFGRENAALLFAPGALFEILFPLWLIVKGFNERAAEARAERESVSVRTVTANSRNPAPSQQSTALQERHALVQSSSLLDGDSGA